MYVTDRRGVSELKCNGCSETYPVSEFLKTGRRCSACRRAKRIKYAKSPAGRAVLRAGQEKYRSKNRGSLRAKAREYASKNVDKSNARSHERRARQRGNGHRSFSREEIFKRDGGQCWYCRISLDPNDWHLDHVVPIAKGGPHIQTNTVASCPGCNRRKGSRPPERPWRAPVRFWLYRRVDVSGVSGTGYVAEGVVFVNGAAVVSWLSDHSSTNVYDSMADVLQIHGHDGATEVVWEE